MTSSREDDVTAAAAAARYRLRQLVRQHPPHDTDARHCTSLRNSDEVEQLEQFNRQRRLHQLGRAQFLTAADLSDHTNHPSTLCKQVIDRPNLYVIGNCSGGFVDTQPQTQRWKKPKLFGKFF